MQLTGTSAPTVSRLLDEAPRSRFHRRAVVIYHAIIQRANREAIADMAILNAGKEDKQ